MIASEGGIVTAEGGMVASEGGIVAAEGGIVAAEGGMIALEGGIVVSEGGIIASEGDIMHLEGDITSFVGCKTTILPNLQAPSAPANPSSRRRFGAISIGRGILPPCPPPPWIRAWKQTIFAFFLPAYLTEFGHHVLKKQQILDNHSHRISWMLNSKLVGAWWGYQAPVFHSRDQGLYTLPGL